jgi:hypothetical protein
MEMSGKLHVSTTLLREKSSKHQLDRILDVSQSRSRRGAHTESLTAVVQPMP